MFSNDCFSIIIKLKDRWREKRQKAEMIADLSDIPVIVGGFLFGPVESLIIAVLKILIKI